MAEMTMVGNWTGPHPSSINQPPTSSGVRPAAAYRDAGRYPAAHRPSTPPPPATGRRPVAPVVDIQICMALSGRPSSLEGLSPEPADAAELGSAPTVAASQSGSLSSWPDHDSVVPLARPRAVARPAQPGPPAAPVRVAAAAIAAPPAVLPAVAPASCARSIVPPAKRRRSRWPLLLALAAVLLAGALQLRLRTPIAVAGTVHAPAAVQTVAAAQPGTLVQLLVQPGEAVAQNQLVARLAAAPFEAELRVRWEAFLELQRELAAAEANAGLERAPSAEALARAAGSIVDAQAALAAASVRAPCRGRVEALAAQPGSVVTQGQALLHIAPAGVSRSIIALLPADQQPFVQPGARAEVLLPRPQPAQPVTSEALVTQITPGASVPEELRALLPAGAGFIRVQLELQGAAPELLDSLRAGERVQVHLQGREQRVLSLVLASMRTLLG